MKERANLPFQLQSFYHGFPPARTAVWEVFLLVSARPTITKAVPHCKIHGEMFSLPAEKWILKGSGHTSVSFWLTLYFWVEKHIQQCPSESGGGGLRTSCKQVCGHQTKVIIVETILFSCLTLWRANKWVIGAGVFAGQEDCCPEKYWEALDPLSSVCSCFSLGE